MKKTFILAFFMMFCSMVFGQNYWTTNSYLYENTMSMQVGLTISGEEIAADNYEIAAFYDGKVVGNGMFEEINGRYQTSLFVYGPQNGAPIQFKLYDHESQRELGLPSEEIAFVIDGNIGTILNPRMINFSAAAKIGDIYYAKLQDAITAATSGNTIQFLADIKEDVTISTKVTIDGAGKTYTGKMTAKADVTVKNVNFDGQGYNGYAFETRGANYVTIEDCTAQNYGYGFVQLASGTALTTVKNVTVSDMNYGVKVDYSGAVVLENVDITAGVAALLNSNYGEKTITIKDSKLNILGTWTRNNTIKTTYSFEGANTVGEWVIDAAIDNFKLATKESTLTAPNEVAVTTDVAGHGVKYAGGKYYVAANMVAIGEETYASLAEALAAAKAGDQLTFLADIKEDVTISKNVTIDGAEFSYTGTMTANKGLTVAVQNVNFVNAGFDKPKAQKSTTGTYTFKDCTFDGYNNTYPYAIRVYGAKKVDVENCTVKNYMYSFFYVPSATLEVNVKDVTVEDCPNYAVYFASGVNTANIEGLTVKNSNNGLIINNSANRALTLKGCKFENVKTAINHTNGTNGITCTLQGENDFGTAESSEYAKYVLSNTESTLKAVEGLNVKVASSLESAGYMVEYSDGIYYVAEGLLGSGTEEDPFIIDNLGKLVIFRDHVNSGKTKYNAEGVHVALAANIDMATEDWNVNIGDDCNYTFDGIFDGKGYILSNLNSVEKAQKTDGYICTGLFGAIAGNAVVKNFTIENVNINTADFTGNNVAAVVGFIYNGNPTIEGVTVKNATINASAAYAVGTVAGYSFEAGVPSIKNCVVEGAEINAASGSGAIVGHCAGRATIEGNTVKDIEIKAKGLVGGIAGLVDSKNSVLNNNTVVNVTLETTGEFWANSAAIAVGTMVNDGLTVAGTTFENVNVNRMVGSVYAYKPQTEVPAVQARIADKYYGTLQAAIDAAVNGNEIVLLSDIELSDEDIAMSAPLKTMVYVEGKDITLDMNGKTISVKYEGEPHLIGVVCVADAAGLTVKGEGSIEVEGVAYDDQFNVAYVFYKRGTTGHLTIEDGTYYAADLEDSMVYTNGDGIVNINGGSFTLDKVGAQANGFPCIFNTQGQNSRRIIVNGGTFNTDVNHQFWANEVYVPETLALQNNGDNTWTVVESVAYVNEIGTSTGSKERKVGYASLADAVKSTGATVTVIKDHETKAPAIVEKDFTIDMNGMAVTAAENVYPVIRVQKGANVTVTGEGSIENATDYVFVLGSSDKETSGNLTIENGTFTGMTTVASVTKGLLTINGGEFKVKDGEYGSTYLINCYDANYADSTATVAICGGTFYGFNPESNAAEGANTNFCAVGYNAVETGTGIWTVVPKQVQSIAAGWTWFSSYMSEFNGETGLAMLQEQLGENGIEIKNHHDGTSRYEAGYGWYGALKSVNTNSMYMINVAEENPIEIGGAPVTSSTITLKPGWNAIGFPSTESINVADVFAQVQNNDEDLIKSKDQYVGYAGGYWDDGSLQSMEPGKGYMYYNSGTTDQVLVFPIARSRGDVKANATTANNYWVANGAAFANNMTMTAVLNVNGVEMTDNYEVAAFAGEEVRGSARPVYVESIGRYVMFMTIYGEGNEELTFKYIDLDTYEVHNLNDMVVYADNAMLGSLRKPIELCYGTMGIGENGFDTMSLYPNPTTTGRAISLEAVCDMVEVFNALGVKVAEYRNVETIDGIEEAGVYVIRVTNGETVNNCRLIVR